VVRFEACWCSISGEMPSPMKRRIGPPLLAALLIGSCLTGALAHAEARKYPVLAVDPLPEGAELESHAPAISRWLARGFTNAVLLHIDAHDRVRPLETAQSAALAEIRSKKTAGFPTAADLGATGRRSTWEAGFVRAVVALGIVRETYWIVPFDHFRRPDPAGSLRADMKDAGFEEQDLRTFVLQEGCFRGTVAESPFSVCGPEELPRIADPVLLSLDTDFVMSAAAVAGTNPIAEMRKLLAALAGRRYAVLDAVIFTSVDPERVSLVSPDLLWVGETIAQALREPSLLARPDQPKRWALLQTLASLESVGNYTEMMHQALPYLTVHDEDPAIQLYAADALAGRAKTEEALEHAVQACRLHQGYCSGLPWIGLKLFAAGDIDGGERFFAAGQRLRPGMLMGQLVRGLVLKKAERPAEALKAFLALSDGGDVLPGAFLAGALHLQLGDRQAARRQFDSALEALPTVSNAQVIDPDTAHAIREAARLYREEGLLPQAELLDGNPRLQLRRDPDPPVQP